MDAAADPGSLDGHPVDPDVTGRPRLGHHGESREVIGDRLSWDYPDPVGDVGDYVLHPIRPENLLIGAKKKTFNDGLARAVALESYLFP